MVTWIQDVHARARVLHDQISIAINSQKSSGVDLTGLVHQYQTLLENLYEQDLPLARILDESDLVVHAEGPAARQNATTSNAVAWLCEEVERRVRQLAFATLHLQDEHARSTSDLRVLLDGLAAGSLYLGFSFRSANQLELSEAGFEELALVQAGEVEAAIGSVREAVQNLTTVPDFVGDESVSEEIAEAIPDAAIRDATLLAAYHLAPTGRRGIHTVELSAPKTDRNTATLRNRERVVLRESALRRPIMRRTRQGSFVGELKEVDLDFNRFQLRSVPGVGTLRCVMSLPVVKARKFLGRGVKVTGTYETDVSGRPRLMRVDTIEPYQIQDSLKD